MATMDLLTLSIPPTQGFEQTQRLSTEAERVVSLFLKKNPRVTGMDLTASIYRSTMWFTTLLS